MTNSRLDAFFETFPFAREAFGDVTVKEAYVLPIDGTLDEASGIDEDEWPADFTLLDQNCQKIFDVGVRFVPKKWYLPFAWMRRIDFRETISCAVLRAEAAGNTVHSILKFEYCNKRMILFRPPTGFTVQEWLEKIHRDDCDEIQKTVAAINALAKPQGA